MHGSRFFMIALLVAMALVATSCAPVATPAPAQPPAAEAKPAVTVENPPTSAEQVDAISLEGKKIEVIYWHNRPQKDQDFLQSLLDEFNASNPYGIVAKAEIAGASYNDVYNKINAAIQAGEPPSMAVAYQNQAALYRGQGAVIDLTPFIKSEKYGLSEADLQDYFQAFLDSDANPQFQGERLGFPTQRSMEVMYYNVDWLNKLGYSEPPTDWDTFEEICCKAAQEEGKYGWAFRHDASNFASQVFAAGGRILAEDGKSYVFNSEAGVQTLSRIQRLFANKCAVEIPVSERYGEQNRFGAGDVLFVFASSSGLPYYQQAVASAANFKWDVAMLPNNGKPAVNLYGASVSVFKTTPEEELAAWLVIKFLGETEQTARWAAQTGYLPVRQSAKDQVVAAFKANEQWGPVADTYAKMFDWAQYSMIESPVAGYDPVRKMIDEEVMSPVLTDPNADVQAILDAAVAKANEILEENAPK